MSSLSLSEVKTWFENNFTHLTSSLTITFNASLLNETWTVTNSTETFTGTVDNSLTTTVKIKYLRDAYTITCGAYTQTVNTGNSYGQLTATIGGA